MKFKLSFLFIFVFITGAAIMMIEMVAFRLMTIYFGASLFVWANVIGLVMISLAIGYYFGGKFADLYPKKEILMFIVLGAGALLSFLPIIYKITLPFFIGSSANIFFGGSLAASSFIFVGLVFFFPITLLAIVSPFVIRLQNKEIKTTGSVSGSVYAFSTAGSIFGTFFASFITIPLLGTKETIVLSAISLILISLIGLGLGRKKVFLLFLLFPLLANFVSPKTKDNLVYEKESFYGLVQVIKDEKLGYVLDINRSGRWSVYHPDKILTGMYFDYFAPLYFLLEKKEDLDVLIIGHAGGVISHQYSYFFKDKNIKIDGVELDPEVTKVAYKFFNLAEQKNLNVINADGRIYLQNNQKQYDLIFIDAYVGALYIPFQLSTKESFDLTKSHLKEDGIFAMMVLARNPNKERTFQCLSQTIKSVYSYTYFFPSESRGEYFIVSSGAVLNDKFLNLEKKGNNIEKLREINKDISQNFKEIQETQKRCILTDNWAPMELFTEIDRLFPKKI